MKYLLITTSLLCGLATSAFAGNPAPAPALAPIAVAPIATSNADWGEFYAGGMVGFASGTQEYANPDFAYDLENTTTYGGFAGYNVQRGSLVFGGEAAYSTGGIGPTGFPDETYTYFLDTKARVGFDAGKFMVFGFAGWTFSEFDNVTEVVPQSGLNYGAGIDMKLGSRMFVGAEYMVRDLSGGGNSALVGQARSANIQSVQIRVGMQF